MATTSQNEAARKLLVTVRPGDAPVKSENDKAVADRSESEQCGTRPFSVLEGDDSLVGLNVDTHGTSSSLR